MQPVVRPELGSITSVDLIGKLWVSRKQVKVITRLGYRSKSDCKSAKDCAKYQCFNSVYASGASQHAY